MKEAFWDNVEIDDLEECGPWNGSVRGASYGQCSERHDPSRIASRAAYKSVNGPLPDT